MGSGSICGDQLEGKQRPTRSRSTSGWGAAGGPPHMGVSVNPGGVDAQPPSSQVLCAPRWGTRAARVHKPHRQSKEEKTEELWLPPVPRRGHPRRKWGRGAPLRAFGQNPKVPNFGAWFQLAEPFSCVGYISGPSRPTARSLRAGCKSVGTRKAPQPLHSHEEKKKFKRASLNMSWA